MKEPGLEKLALYRAGLLADEEARRIKDLLDSGSHWCQQATRWLELVEQSAAVDVRQPVPDHLQEMARRAFRQYKRALQKTKPGVAWAVCIFDSLLSPLPAGVRPAVTDARRLLYVTDGYEIDIETNPSTGGRYVLLGQVTRVGEPVVSAQIITSVGRRKMQAVSDELGVFSLRDLPVGEVNLTITAEKVAVEVSQIPIGT